MDHRIASTAAFSAVVAWPLAAGAAPLAGHATLHHVPPSEVAPGSGLRLVAIIDDGWTEDGLVARYRVAGRGRFLAAPFERSSAGCYYDVSPRPVARPGWSTTSRQPEEASTSTASRLTTWSGRPPQGSGGSRFEPAPRRSQHGVSSRSTSRTSGTPTARTDGARGPTGPIAWWIALLGHRGYAPSTANAVGSRRPPRSRSTGRPLG